MAKRVSPKEKARLKARKAAAMKAGYEIYGDKKRAAAAKARASGTDKASGRIRAYLGLPADYPMNRKLIDKAIKKLRAKPYAKRSERERAVMDDLHAASAARYGEEGGLGEGHYATGFFENATDSTVSLKSPAAAQSRSEGQFMSTEWAKEAVRKAGFRDKGESITAGKKRTGYKPKKKKKKK